MNTPHESPSTLRSITTPATITRFRMAVEDLSKAATLTPIDGLGKFISDGLTTDAIALVVDAGVATENRQTFVDDLVADVVGFRRSSVSSATHPAAALKIRLLALLDAAWWSGAPSYHTDADILSDGDLVDLDAERKRGGVKFHYRVQASDLPRRGVRAIERRVRPHHSPHTIGMRLAFGRPEVVSLLNSIARELARTAPGSPPLWVNSLVRSVEYQNHMRRRGYTAATGSAHCTGWAADVEMTWMRQRNAGDALARVLLARANSGQLNVIDEGQAWHVCLNPSAVNATNET